MFIYPICTQIVFPVSKYLHRGERAKVMIAIASIFPRLQDIQRAVEALISIGVHRDQSNLLPPNSDEFELQQVPSGDT